MTGASPLPGIRRVSDDRTLTAALRTFYDHLPPRIVTAVLVLAIAFRLALGGFAAADTFVVLGMLVIHPFIEWTIHVFVLHARPMRIVGRKIDLRLARYHRAHHRDPSDIRWILMPMPQSLVGLGVEMGVAFSIMPTAELGATAMVVVAAAGLMYEWTHFLIHTPYRPRSGIYRRAWMYHRLHHFKNERYWFGVTMHAADVVLGTMPKRDGVPTSETCRTLGLEDELDG